MRVLFAFLSLNFLLSGCGVVYFSPRVTDVGGDRVRVVAMTPETVLVANRSEYYPQSLPGIFFATSGGTASAPHLAAAPAPTLATAPRRGRLETRLPPQVQPQPYRIGVSDVVLLATPQAGNTLEQLSGLLAAQNSRQGYTVQDDGAIAIPNVGRVQVAGLTLEEAEAALFQRLVENQIDPAFSLEIAEFNSRRISIGGAVAQPTVVPVTLTPLFLDQALAAAGGITVQDQDFASIRIYRDGTLYQIPLTELYSNRGLQQIQLVDGDSVFVDTEYDLARAQDYFAEQIQLAQFRQSARAAALSELQAEVGLRRAELSEARSNYETLLQLDAVKRDYVYLTGEVAGQGRFVLPFGRQATLADALFDTGGLSIENGDVREIYVLRASPDPRDFGAVTAWNLNARAATNFLLATQFELRPNDVIFVAEQPVTRWNRTLTQITPSIINQVAAAAAN